MQSQTRDSYTRRAPEYIDHLGSVSAAHPADRHLIETWGAGIDGPLLDAGCGPGHWTGLLAERGHDARGVDLVPAFIDHARASHPCAQFAVGSIDDLGEQTGSLGGILCWYALIHHEPDTVAPTLREFARVIRPGGGLLLGFFTGPAIERFDHAVTAAYYWPVDSLTDRVRAAGFEILETHTRTGQSHRPHGAIVARRNAAS